MTVVSLSILPVSDLRNKAKDVLKRVQTQPIVITQRSRPRAVLVEYEQYNEMARRLGALEDARDALLLERAMATATEFVTLEEALADYEQATGVRIELDELLEAAKRV